MKQTPNVVVIVGPTASGKSGLAVELAQQFDGEVISADSRQVYRGLDIGTAKITPEEMQGVPHHLLDVVEPHVTYTAADFVRDGRQAIAHISARGKLPIIAGGTFFYIDSLLGRVSYPEVPPNEALRKELEQLDTATLLEQLTAVDEARATAIDPHNRRRLIRALEIADALGSIPPPRAPQETYDVLTIGIKTSPESLRQTIRQRLRTRIEHGLIEEVQRLLDAGLSPERLDELGLEYRYVTSYLQDLITKEEMLETLATKINQYAKRQRTWLKRDPTIQWFDRDDKEIFDVVRELLARD